MPKQRKNTILPLATSTFFCGDHLKNFCEDLFFLESTCACVLGLEHSCPWPREGLSSERLSLALASDFFCVLGLGLAPCVLDSTSVHFSPLAFSTFVLVSSSSTTSTTTTTHFKFLTFKPSLSDSHLLSSRHDCTNAYYLL